MAAEFRVMLTTHIMVKDTPKITAYRDHRMRITGTRGTHSRYSVYAAWNISNVRKKKKKLGNRKFQRLKNESRESGDCNNTSSFSLSK